MNDLHNSCEPWTERISLAAAGCLSSAEEQDVHRHIETCSDCRERFQQLSRLCGVLAEARLPADSADRAVVERVMAAVASEQSQRPLVSTHSQTIQLPQFANTLNSWRRVMRSTTFRISTGAILLLVVTGIALWFHGAGTTSAFADFIEPILTAKSVTFKQTCEEKGHITTGKVMAISSPQRMRLEHDMPGNQKSVLIIDDMGNSLALRPAQKVAMLTTCTNVPGEKRHKAIFFELRSQLADARDLPDWIREPLGEKVIDGRRLIGYRLTGHGMICTLWGDPKTGMPVRIETIAPSDPNVKMIASDFVFDVDLDESLFSLKPPTGYKVQKQTMDLSPAKEKDLIETLRRYAQLRDGALPDQLDISAFTKLFQEDWAKSHPMKGSYPNEKEMQELLKGLTKFTRGISFVFEELPREADAHYAGKGVKLGAINTPIFWYRPKHSKKYRVIYADLSVRESDTAPACLRPSL
ncbi:MAG: zf-HC2 domain-containing protein [Thermoguttaceae bacterium]